MAIPLGGCQDDFWLPGDDYGNDDDYPDGDDPPGPDDTLNPGTNTVISGEVIAIDRDTNVMLTPSQYDARAGGMILYVLPSAQDISEVFAKVVLSEPGPYEVVLEGYVGPFEVMLVVDENKNQFIDAGDTAREYPFNPLAAAGNPIEDVNVYIDLPYSGLGGPPGGGGANGLNGDPGDPDDDESVSTGCVNTVIDGDVNIIDFPEGNVAVTTNSPDFVIGPREVYVQAGSGPFAAAECNSAEYTAILGYLDADNNGYFEPSDPIGEAAGNPFVLGAGDVSGVQLDIPAIEEVLVPQPPLYVPITGTVIYGNFTTGDILVHATYVSSQGMLYSSATLAGPGPFSIIAPANTSGLLIWAVLDEDGDGTYDIATAPFDSVGPLDSGNGITQLGLDLGSGPTFGEVGGVILYNGSVAPPDLLHINLQPGQWGPETSGVAPVLQLDILDPVFPVYYSFEDVPTGNYWVSAQFDIGGNNPTHPPGPEDPVGSVGPLLLSPGHSINTATFSVAQE